ncbi:SAM-dependent methyltransferase [Cyanobacteria bacterium FACHB-DQ100]|nr:SAM-dependent methyltransferase [Cyanobacteria bacterium FACHB-DQ100]
MQTSSPTLLEKQQRFSQSLLWQLQRNFYNQQGIQAWNSGVLPHYATSNPTIAYAYAKVILAYLRDHLQNHTLDPSHPLYILELGAGCGRFAFYCLRYLQRHLPLLGASLPPVVYVMSDFTQSNLDYWQHHGHLKPFLEAGILDFSVVDATAIDSLYLAHSGQRISATSLKNPLIAIANYFFDCIPQDVFVIEGGKLHESLVTLTTSHPTPDLETPDLIDSLDITFIDQETTSNYYNDPHFNAILANYQTTLTDTTLLFPSTALKCLRQLHQLAQGRLLLLSADQGYNRFEDLRDGLHPRLNPHGQSFSMMVNFHAIGQYTQHLGGTWLTTPHYRPSFTINAFLFSDLEQSLAQTQEAYNEHILTGGPDDFLAFNQGLDSHYDALSLSQLLAYLRLSHWDFIIFWSAFPSLMGKLKDAPKVLYPDILTAVQQVWLNYFPIQEEFDLAFLLGTVLYTLGYFPEALEYWQQSRQLYGEDPSTLFNMAMCHYRLHQLELAIDFIQQTLALDPDFEGAKAKYLEWQAELMQQAHTA